jgi:hypothetical protein
MEDGLLASWPLWCLILTVLLCAGMIAGAVTWLAWFLGVQMELLWREIRDRPPTAR